jgi:hypothetical protein
MIRHREVNIRDFQNKGLKAQHNLGITLHVLHYLQCQTFKVYKLLISVKITVL